MVCPRCVSAVESILDKMNIIPLQINLGEVILKKELNLKQTEQIREKLDSLGFELLDDNLSKQITKIKSLIILHIHHSEDVKFVFSEILASELNKEYSQLSKLFSSTEGITIEQFVILQKIEKVKELLIYNQNSLSEIAYRMGYSSVAHLSSQFKKTVGLTPSKFKAQSKNSRKAIDAL